ncbi:MAG: PAS domain-containing protein [Nocardioides sp.]
MSDVMGGQRVRATAGAAAVGALLLGVFTVDMLTNVGFAAGMLYVPVVLLAYFVATPRWVGVAAAVAVVLAVVGAALSPPLPALSTTYVVLNRAVACVAIATCGWFGASMLSTRLRLLHANEALQAALQRDERQTRMLEIAGEVGHFGGWTVDVPTNTIRWSAEVAHIHGMSPESMHSVETGISFYVPEDRPRITEAFNRCVRDGTPFNEELQLVRQSDGALRWVNAIGRAERDENGEVVVVHGALQDITDRIEAQLEAQSSRRALGALGEAMPFIIWTAAPDGAIDYASEELWRYSGVLTREVLGDAWLQLVHPDDRAEALATWRAATDAGAPISLQYRFRRTDGRYRWHLVRAVPERAPDGSVVRWWGSNTDIDDLRSLEQQASDLAAQLHQTLESIGDAVLALDTEWRVRFVNSHAELLLQHRRDELVGRNIWMVFPEAVGSIFQQEYERAVAERHPTAFSAPFEPLGIEAEVSAYPHDQGLTIYFRDVSRRRVMGHGPTAGE